MTQSSQFDALQFGSQMRVVVRINGREVTTFDIAATDFECFIATLDRQPVVTVTHCDPTTALDHTYRRNLG